MILITGCLGFIGFWLSKTLLDKGYSIIGIDVPFDEDNVVQLEKYNILKSYQNFSIIFKDLLDINFEKVIISLNIQYIFHFAAKSQVRKFKNNCFNSFNDFIDDIRISHRILEASIGKKLKKIIFASSASVYGNKSGFMKEDDCPKPISDYGISKLTIEHIFQSYWINYNLPTIIMRFFTVYGEYQPSTMGFHKFIENLIDEKEIHLFNNGVQKRDFTNIRDVVSAYVNILANNNENIFGEIYNIGTGRSSELLESVKILERISKKKAKIKYIVEDQTSIISTLADISKAKRLLDYIPTVSLVEGLEKQFNWIMEIKDKQIKDKQIKDKQKIKDKQTMTMLIS